MRSETPKSATASASSDAKVADSVLCCNLREAARKLAKLDEDAQLLRAQGARVDLGCDNAQMHLPPMHVACQRGHLECVNLILLQRGVVADQKAVDGRTPLYAACESGSVKIVELLLNKGCDIEARRNDNSTPLIVASVFGHYEVVELLLARGALLKPRDEDGTAVDNARRQKKTRCLALLEAAMSERGVLEPEEGYTTFTTQAK